jgi:hypothetical protein
VSRDEAGVTQVLLICIYYVGHTRSDLHDFHDQVHKGTENHSHAISLC